MKAKIYRIAALTGLLLAAISMASHGQKVRKVENGAVVSDTEMIRIPRYQFEYGQWEKYRRGEFDNLRITNIDGRRYLLSRTYAEEHRHQQGSYGHVPIFAFHYHTHYNGAILDETEVARLRDIQQGDTLKVESRIILNDFETEEFDEYLGAILSERRTHRGGFFLWATRTKDGRKDVIRITDTGDVDGFKVFYWEIPYKTYKEFFE